MLFRPEVPFHKALKRVKEVKRAVQEELIEERGEFSSVHTEFGNGPLDAAALDLIRHKLERPSPNEIVARHCAQARILHRRKICGRDPGSWQIQGTITVERVDVLVVKFRQATTVARIQRADSIRIDTHAISWSRMLSQSRAAMTNRS